jgi:hypothetical protein
VRDGGHVGSSGSRMGLRAFCTDLPGRRQPLAASLLRLERQRPDAGEQKLQQVPHRADFTAKRQGCGAAEEQSFFHIPPQRGCELGVDAKLSELGVAIAQSASARAARISRSSALRLAWLIRALSRLCLVSSIRSGWWRRRSTLASVPTAPCIATVPASRCAETPTPIPPCTIGSTMRPPSARKGRAAAAAGRGSKEMGMAIYLTLTGEDSRHRTARETTTSRRRRICRRSAPSMDCRTLFRYRRPLNAMSADSAASRIIPTAVPRTSRLPGDYRHRGACS